MHLVLHRHRDTPCEAVTGIAVEVARSATGLLHLSYTANGEIAGLCLPPPATPVRTDDLWRHTCFEAFLGPVPGTAYLEFNVAPSTQWAAYHFDFYRAGMRPEPAAPRIAVQATASTFTLDVTLDLASLPRAPWRLGLTAVIEEKTGRKSYWALAHPPGKPDFHHADCFAAQIAAASGS